MEASPAAAGKHASSTMNKLAATNLNRRQVPISVLGKSYPSFDLDNTLAGDTPSPRANDQRDNLPERRSAFE